MNCRALMIECWAVARPSGRACGSTPLTLDDSSVRSQPFSETLSRRISAGHENHLVRSATMLSPLVSEAAPPDTGSSTSDLQVAADGAAPSQCLPLAELLRRSTHGHRPFHLPSH